jgi:hypothetical protein
MQKLVSQILTACAISGGTVLASSVIFPVAAFDLDYKQYEDPVGHPANDTQSPSVGISQSDIGRSFAMDWSLSQQEIGTSEDLQATGTFTVNDFSRNQLDITVDVTNETAPSFQSAIVSMGWSVPGQDASASWGAEGDTFQNVGKAKNFPGGFKDLDACVSATNNCNGGDIKKGLQSGGNSDSFQVSLKGDFGDKPSVYLQDFSMKFQSEAGSYELPGEAAETSTSSDFLYYHKEEVPEPSMGLGLLALAGSLSIWYRRYHRR